MMVTALLITHGLVAVALLGAITHQTLSAWTPVNARPGSFFGRFRTVPPAAFANAVVVLYLAAAVFGGIIYLDFRVDVRPTLEQAGHWQVLGFFDLAVAFVAPAMFWYGWAATAALGALIFGLVAAALPDGRMLRFWMVWFWVIPVLAMIACVYLTMPWFRL